MIFMKFPSRMKKKLPGKTFSSPKPGKLNLLDLIAANFHCWRKFSHIVTGKLSEKLLQQND